MKQEHKDLLFKALSSYLPYKLKICYRVLDLENGDPTTDNPDDRMKDCIMILDGHRLEYGTLSEKDRWYDKNSLFKPILRPLSKLNEEIEHEGKKFKPIDVLSNWTSSFYSLDGFYYSDDTGEMKKIELEQLEHFQFTKLISWHFDVYGLIELGLAIEKN